MPELQLKAEHYLRSVREQVPRYDELQAAAIEAIPFAPASVLELGIGTGETSRRLLERFPDARVTGLDSDPDMVFRARRQIDDVRLARIEDPLPDGPWDLVISVLAAHRLDRAQKLNLYRRVRQHSGALVLGDFVAAGGGAGTDEGVAFSETAEQMAGWSGGEIAWAADDLAVIRADYR